MKGFVSPLLIFFIISGLAVFQLWRYHRGIEKRARFSLWAITISFLIVWLLSTPFFASYLTKRLEDRILLKSMESLTQLDVIVVLGAGIGIYDNPENDELALPTRVIKGVRVFKKTEARIMVMSGGNRRVNEGDRMVKAMKRLAMDMGVPEERILLESMSRNTIEHPVFISKMKEVQASDRIGLVTSCWHMPRALYEFKKKFLSVVPIQCGEKEKISTGFTSWLPDAGSLSKSTIMIQEYVGMVWYRFWY